MTKSKDDNGKTNLISAAELLTKFNISYQTLNHYTNIGLLESASRKGLRRFYDADDVRVRLEKIKELQNKGYTLRLICEAIKSDKEGIQ